MVIGYYGSNGTSNNYILDVNSSETNLNVSNYASGFYTVALVVNRENEDTKTLIKQKKKLCHAFGVAIFK